MQTMKFFIDTHDSTTETFPAGLTPEQFEAFYADYEKACYAEDVVPLRVHVGYSDEKAFCFTMAPNANAVRRAHERIGLPFDSITEVTTATPGDTFYHRSMAE
jgi:hypothetical protein